MKVSLLFLIAFAALAASDTVPVDKNVKKQGDVLALLHRIQQHNIFDEQVTEGNNYDVEAHMNNYHNPRVVKNFLAMYKKGLLLKRGVPFTIYYAKHKEQAVMLFELFYYANDYDTFYKTACWARDRVNEGMFMYSYSVAVLHRSDTQNIKLPPIYEVYPYLFFHSDVIQEAYEYKMQGAGASEEHHSHVIYHNFTLHNKEDKVAYFREDVFLNAFATYYWYLYPTWMNFTKYGIHVERPGEQFYYINQQIYARYLNAKLAEEMEEVKPFEYEKTFKTPYNPKLRYHNGQEVASRPNNLKPSSYEHVYLSDIKNYEHRVGKVIDLGAVFVGGVPHLFYDDEKPMEIISEIIEGSHIYRHYTGSLYHRFRSMLGHITDPFHKYEVAPSVLLQNEAYLRDPGYYQLWKRIQHYFDKFLKRLPHYTHEELSFDGVKIDSVEVGKLYTYFEPHEFNLNTVGNIRKLEDIIKMDIKVRKYRLNHKPFTYKIELTSDNDAQAYVRVYLGPKNNYLGNECDLNERRKYFVEIDQFPYHVKVGKNVIERNSHDSSVVAREEDSYRVLYKKVTEALEGKSTYHFDKTHAYCGLPEHLLIPKGRKEGLDYSFYVIVSPYEKPAEENESHFHAFSYCGAGPNNHYPNKKPLGFPFDRPLHSWDFETPNMYFKDVTIFHKKYDEVESH